MSETEEKNKALVRRFLEVQSKGEVDTVKEMLALDFVEDGRKKSPTIASAT